MTPLYYRYRLAIEGVHIVITMEWSTSNATGASPFLTETVRRSLTDGNVTADSIAQEVRDRAVVIRRGLKTHQEITARFGGNQNTWLAAP